MSPLLFLLCAPSTPFSLPFYGGERDVRRKREKRRGRSMYYVSVTEGQRAEHLEDNG